MKINLYSIKDTKLGKYCQPFTAPNDDIAKRMLASTMLDNNPNNGIRNFPEDYQLYKLGKYDEDTGELITETKFIVNATEYKKITEE